MKIKARAWDRDAERMVYPGDDYCTFGFEDGILKAWRIIEIPATLDEPAYPGSEELEDPPMLWIGLKDKHGKEIYGKDIVRGRKANGMELFVVEYGIWSCLCCNYVYGYNFASIQNMNCEVIGNVFETSELIVDVGSE